MDKLVFELELEDDGRWIAELMGERAVVYGDTISDALRALAEVLDVVGPVGALDATDN